jgi:hypothetical protein
VKRVAALAAVLLLSSRNGPALAAPVADAPASLIDRVAVRFWSPETGGAAHPRFIDERTLAFEARLAAMAERQEGIGDGYQERHVRDALEHEIGERMLASLARKLLAELPAAKKPADADFARLQKDLGTATFDAVGGEARVTAAAAAEGLGASDVEATLRRQTLAAWYLDRTLTPILQPSEEQLREVYRTAAHPFRGRPFEEARADLLRWFVADRVHAGESAFFQSARARVKIVVTK